MGEGYKGVRDYEIVIELLRENLVEPVIPAPTHLVSPQNVLPSLTVIHTAVQLYCTILYCAVLRSLQAVRSDEGAIKEVVES